VYEVDGRDLLFTHAYSIPDGGRSTLLITEIHWDEDDWPSVDPLSRYPVPPAR